MVSGFALIALGLLDGPAAGLKKGLEQFQRELGIGPSVWKDTGGERLPGQIWLAVIGAVFVLLALAGWLMEG